MVQGYSMLLSIIFMMIKSTDKFNQGQETCPTPRPQHYGEVIENVLPKGYRWPNATIPYLFDGVFDESELSTITDAMDLLSTVSCVQFKRRTTETHHLVITNNIGTGCWADTGRQPRGATYANLSKQCTKRAGTILHELLHVLGFLHQHTRPDRDRYLCVLYDNIQPHPITLYNYEIVRPWTELVFPLPYDFESIMHYTPEMYSVAAGRLPTMVPRRPWSSMVIGQQDRLTEYDVLGIQFLYCLV